jgi:hypothetical protein
MNDSFAPHGIAAEPSNRSSPRQRYVGMRFSQFAQ